MKSDPPALASRSWWPSPRNFFIYLALMTGAVVFGWPFLWMATTSIRLEKELYRDKPHLWPETPTPHPVSPYVDTRYYENVRGPRMDEALADIEGILKGPGYAWPADVDRDAVIEAAATGIYKQLRESVPPGIWSEGAANLRQTLKQDVTPAAAAEMVVRVRRALCLGEVSIESYYLENQKLVSGPEVAAAMQQGASGNVELTQQAGASRSRRFTMI